MTRILCIEDDVPFVTSLARQLESVGYEVDIATTGIAGLWQAANNAPDLILCDLTLPGRDGHSVIAVLALIEVTRAIPIVIITGQERAKVLAELAVPVAGVLTKPLDLDALLARITAAVGAPPAGSDDPQPTSSGAQSG